MKTSRTSEPSINDPADIAEKGVSWSAISAEFDLLCVMAADLNFPSADELDAYKASLAAPHLVQSNLPQQLAQGKLPSVPKGGDGSAHLEQSIRILRSQFAKPAPHRHLAHYFQEPIAIVKEAIAKQHLSLDFVWAWGRLQEAAGHLQALLIPGGSVEMKFWNGFQQAKKTDTTLQRYWYAHWMVKNGVFDRRINRVHLNDSLSKVCDRIVRGRLKPLVHAKEWFASLIERETDPESARLKTPYMRLSLKDISRMANNRLIPLSALPPLSAGKFSAADDYTP